MIDRHTVSELQTDRQTFIGKQYVYPGGRRETQSSGKKPVSSQQGFKVRLHSQRLERLTTVIQSKSIGALKKLAKKKKKKQ